MGGLIGQIDSGATASQVYATGNVTGSGKVSLFGGTIVGNGVGGLVGANFGTITNAYAQGNATATSGCACYVGGFVGDNEGSISYVYSVGAVTGTGSTLGALAGANGASTTSGVSITDGYWNTDITGVPGSGGLPGIGSNPNNLSVTVVGMTTTGLQSSCRPASPAHPGTSSPAEPIRSSAGSPVW